jgi:hypothetical protein
MPFTNPKTHAMGGTASGAKLTKAERKQRALKAARARWAKVQKKAA